MEQLALIPTADIRFHELKRPYEFATPFGGNDFVLLLVINDPSITAEEQVKLSQAFVEQGCRYALCFGHNCSTWDDSIDLAPTLSSENFDLPEDRFVMTTWHENEPLSDVVDFFIQNTGFDNLVFQQYLVLFLGADQARKQAVVERIGALMDEHAD